MIPCQYCYKGQSEHGKRPHPNCPKCGSTDTRRVRNYGRPVDNEWWCLHCKARWTPTDESRVDDLIDEVLAGRDPNAVLLDEATPWTPTTSKDIKTAIKMSVQARATKRDWTIVKQTVDYALAVSAWGPKKEFKLLEPGGHPSTVTYSRHRIAGAGAPIVWTRTLDAHEKGERE